jgi:hypothetical protein
MIVQEPEGSRAVRDPECSPRTYWEPPLTHPTWKATAKEQDPQKAYPEATSLDPPKHPTLQAPEIPQR